MPDPYANQKTAHGGWATYAWLGSCLILFVSDRGIRSLFSLKVVVFFVPGAFLAALVLGGFAYALQRLVARGLMRTLRTPSPDFVSIVRRIGFVLFIVDTLIVFFVARLAYNVWQ